MRLKDNIAMMVPIYFSFVFVVHGFAMLLNLMFGGSTMELRKVNDISDKLQNELKGATNAHEAEAWANALKSFMIAVSIQKDLEIKLANA